MRAAVEILAGITELTTKQMKLERRMRKMEREREVERMNGSDSKKKASMGQEETDESGSGWRDAKVRRQLTYAEVSMNWSKSKKNENEGERIEGRVLVTGKEGWKMPPSHARDGEKTLIISSKSGGDAREIAEKLVRKMPAREIGAVPAEVKPAWEGKLVIVPRDKSQQTKIVEKIGKMKELEITEKKKARPLLMISGIERGMSDEELIEQMARGLGNRAREGENEVKIVSRIRCRNPWRENVIVKMGVNDFRTVVERGRIEMMYVVLRRRVFGIGDVFQMLQVWACYEVLQ